MKEPVKDREKPVTAERYWIDEKNSSLLPTGNFLDIY